MIFRNPTANTLSFSIDDELFTVPPGGECNISPKLAYVVASRGLPLVEGTAGGKLSEPVVEPARKPKYAPGIETGEDEKTDDDESPAVNEAVDKLVAQGVLPKGKRR